MPPPEWALLERALFRATTAACESYFDRYFDDRGYLECVERWGGDDGPDDAIDFLVFSAHKLYAPYGAGVLVAPRDAFRGLPDQLGGGIVEMVTLEHVIWTEVPEREEAGSPNVMGVVVNINKI